MVIPIEPFHMYDPFGTRIKHENKFQQLQDFAFKLTVDELLTLIMCGMFKIQKDHAKMMMK